MTTMIYKGFRSRICYDVADDIFYGHIDGISDGVGFHADEIEDLEEAFREAVDDYIEYTSKAEIG